MPNDFEIISDQLEILEQYQLLGAIERQQILDKLKKEPDKLKDYSESLSKGLPGLTKGVIGAIKAGKSGDPFAISIAAVDIFAGVVTIAGPLLGPAAPIFSALATMISTILGEFLPKPPSLKEELTTLLDKFLAEEKLRSLGTALDQIWVLSDTIEHHSLEYNPLNIQHGPEIKAIDDAWQWLKQKDKQTVPLWGEVLEKTCLVWIQLMRCVALSVLKPSTKAGVQKNAMLVYLPARQEIFLKYMRSIKPVAQERGLYVVMQAWASYGNVIYTAVGQEGNLPFNYKKNTSWMRNVSIVVSKEQLGSSTPKYDLIACGANDIARHTLDSVTGDLSDGQQFMIGGHEYPDRGEATRVRFTGCIAAWALPDWELPKSTRIYTAHATTGLAQNYCYVNIHQVDEENNVKRINWAPQPAAGLEHIRAVVGDISDSLPDDPDVAGMPSRQYEIIYAGYRDSPNIWVELDNSWRDVPSPWQRYNGIEVDRYGLWVFGENGIAYATHASVIKCKNGSIPRPRWMTYKTAWSDGFYVTTLSPCADGTLAVGSEQPTRGGLVLLTGNYEIKFNKQGQGSIVWDCNGTPRGSNPKQVQKMPIPCWPVFANVLGDLEKQVGQGHPE